MHAGIERGMMLSLFRVWYRVPTLGGVRTEGSKKERTIADYTARLERICAKIGDGQVTLMLRQLAFGDAGMRVRMLDYMSHRVTTAAEFVEQGARAHAFTYTYIYAC